MQPNNHPHNNKQQQLRQQQCFSTDKNNNKQQYYQQFLSWFYSNSGYSHSSLIFPSYFPPTQYIGISSCQSLAANKVILAIPKNLIISVSVVQQCIQLQQIINNPKYTIFKKQDNDDRDYNLIVLYLLYQMGKYKYEQQKKQSFFKPYFDLIQLSQPQTLLDWQQDQIKVISDPYLNNITFINSIRAQFNPIYKQFYDITVKYTQKFKKQLTREQFDKVYAIVMTRGFGWGLPETMLVPFADFFNHNSSGVNHYVFDRKLQKFNDKLNDNKDNQTQKESIQSNEQKQSKLLQIQKQYISKKFQLNLSIFPQINNSNLLPNKYSPTIRQLYLIDHVDELLKYGIISSKQQLNNLNNLDISYTNLLYRLLMYEKLQNDDLSQEYYLSSDSEDNDSEGENDDQEDEQIQTGKKIENIQKENNNEKEQKQTQTQKISSKYSSKSSTSSQSSDQIQFKEQVQQQVKQKPYQPKKGGKQRQYLRWVYKKVDKSLSTKFTQPKPMINSQFEDNVKFDWWYLQQKQEHKNSQKNLQNDKNNRIKQQQKYFIVSTSRHITAYQQIFNCYGRRSNRFLLLWYGFCYQSNKYDSVPFRIFSQNVHKITGIQVYTKYLTQIEYFNGIVMGNQRFSVKELTDQFRLKKYYFCYRLLAYLRYEILKKNLVFREFYKLKERHVNQIVFIEIQIEILLKYQKCLNQLYLLFVGDRINSNKDKNKNKQGKQIKIKPSREYFKSILDESNRQIVQNQMLSVKILIKGLLQLQDYLNFQKINIKNQQIKQMKFSEQIQQRCPNSQKMKYFCYFNVSMKKLNQIYHKRFGSFKENYDENCRFMKYNSNITDQQKTCQNQKVKKVRNLKLIIREYFRQLYKSQIVIFTQKKKKK